jgi:succinate-semialdehyde dehydrogenase
MQDALEKVGAPRELILTIQNPSLEMTNALMEEADVVVATGGFGMVKSAYSSGRPSFGVGQGNVQSFIDTTADIDFATETIITNRSADLGLPCTGEQTVYIPRHLEKEVLTSFEKNGAYVLTDEEVIRKLRQKVFVNNHQNLELTGKKPSDAVKIMELGINVPEETRLLVVKVNQHGEEEVLAKEILWPILRFRLYDDFDEALEWGRINLLMEGAGHTSTIYSATDENIVKAGDRLPVGRVVVNQGGGAGSGARFNNGLDPTISLGCGSWGNNSISENLTHRHLMNVTKVSKVITDAKIPTPEEIWA